MNSFLLLLQMASQGSDVQSCLSSSAENRNGWVSRRTGLVKERGFEERDGGTGGDLLQSFGDSS